MNKKRKLGNPHWRRKKEPWEMWHSFGFALLEILLFLIPYLIVVYVYQDDREFVGLVHAWMGIFGYFILSPAVTWRMLKRVRPSGKPFIWF